MQCWRNVPEKAGKKGVWLRGVWKVRVSGRSRDEGAEQRSHVKRGAVAVQSFCIHYTTSMKGTFHVSNLKTRGHTTIP